MARKNQQDISCFEADRHRLIDDLKINDFRICLPPKRKKKKTKKTNHHKNKQNKTPTGSLIPMPCLKVNWFDC